jgi:enterobactin synthetase component D / holo-[acyl-carrier protein] synthase
MKWQFVDQNLSDFQLGFPQLRDTAIVMANIADHRQHLFAAERADLAPMAEVRQFGFSSGRYCAHLAQSALGCTEAPVLRQDRAPVWPAPSVGSITHSTAIAASVASTAYLGVGIDLEEVGRVKDKLHRMLFTDAEQARLKNYTFDAASVMFSAKEAGYKAIHPIGQKYIGFKDAEIHLQPESTCFTIEYIGDYTPNLALNRGMGYWHICAGHVLTLFVIPKEP